MVSEGQVETVDRWVCEEWYVAADDFMFLKEVG